MAWTEITRRKYRRDGLRYASNLTDAEWARDRTAVSARFTARSPTRNGTSIVVNASCICLHGLPMAAIAAGVPALFDGARLFLRWSRTGVFASINHVLVMAAREKAGREASPTAGVIDSQSVKTTESGGPRGLTRARRSRAASAISSPTRKAISSVRRACSRHSRSRWRAACFGVDPLALSLAAPCLRRRRLCRRQAARRAEAQRLVDARNHQAFGRAKGFEVLPRRWVVERTFAWLGRCRRLAKDFEATITSAVAWVLVAHIRAITRRIARN